MLEQDQSDAYSAAVFPDRGKKLLLPKQARNFAVVSAPFVLPSTKYPILLSSNISHRDCYNFCFASK